MKVLASLRARRPVLWRAVATIVLVCVALVVSDHVSALTDYYLADAAAMSIVMVGLSFLTGVSGQVSLGNGAFMGVGAYTAAIWADHHAHTPIAANLALATLVGAIVGLLVGLPATRLRGPYLAGMTIAIGVAFTSIIAEFGSWTNGDQGLALPRPVGPPKWLVQYLHSTPTAARPGNMWLADIAVVTAGIAFFFMANLFRSRTGRAMRLVRENEVAAEIAGVSLPRARVLAFVVAAACAGLGGALTTIIAGLVSPSTFELSLSIEMLTLLVIGGIGTLSGALLGGIFYAYSSTWITSLVNATGLKPTSNLAASLNGIIFGGLLIVFVLLAPLGLTGTTRFVIVRRLRASRASAADARPVP
ncbi:MAG: branched-chain amino acid ABC transporter permease [Acidimicrobiales bacterium]|jgi:branched-chain amino acid transport system permease protein